MPRPHSSVVRPILRVAVFAAVLGATSLAFAQPSVPPVAPNPAPAPAPAEPPPLGESLAGAAAQDYAAARLLYGSGDYAGALVKFLHAYDASKDPRLLWNAAACEKSLRHYAKAAMLVRRYVDAGPPLVPDSAVAEAKVFLDAVDPLTGRLTVATREPGAAVTVDGELLGTTPLPEVRVDIGTRQVAVEKDGFHRYTATLTVAGNDTLRVDAPLEPVVHQGRLTVRAAAGDVIAIDGATVGMGRWAGELPSGGHQLRVTAPDKYAYQSDVVVADDQERTIDVQLEAKPHGGLPVWLWIAGGAVLAAGAVTVVALALKPSDQQAPSTLGTISPGIVQVP